MGRFETGFVLGKSRISFEAMETCFTFDNTEATSIYSLFNMKSYINRSPMPFFGFLPHAAVALSMPAVRALSQTVSFQDSPSETLELRELFPYHRTSETNRHFSTSIGKSRYIRQKAC